MNDKASLFETNFLLTELIFRSLEKAGGRLTYFSSGEVYGDNPIVPTSERDYSGFDHLGERGYYPEIKRFTELLIKSWSDQTHIPATILRIFHTFGPGLRQDDNRIFADAIRSAAAGRDIRLHSDGSARRSFLYTSDLAEAIGITLADESFDVFNVCGFPELSILEFASIVAEQVEGCRVVRDDSVDSGIFPQSPIKRGLADVTKLKSLGWSQKVSVNEAVSRTISSLRFRANPPAL
jgi:nucleoside-diphosphate-sugar epimerase